MTRRAKTRHILLFMKIKIRPEIGISMCNCVAVKNLSYKLLGSRVTEQITLRNFLRKGDVFMSPYALCYINLHVFLYRSSLKVGKDSWERPWLLKRGLTLCLYRQKDNRIQIEILLTWL